MANDFAIGEGIKDAAEGKKNKDGSAEQEKISA